MRKATKRIYMSILAVLLVFITVVATTYAWVGILTYGQIDTFKLNLKTQDLENDFYLSISATGEEDSYSEQANEYEIKKQIIKNMGYDVSNLTTDELINAKFYKVYKIYPATTNREMILNDEFHEINPELGGQYIDSRKSKSFYKFDLYLSVEHRDGDAAITPDTNVNMELILANIENTLNGDTKTQVVQNSFAYPSSEIYNPNNFDVISGAVKVDASSAARIALAVYDPILRTDEYSGNEVPNLMFYQGGTQLPTYDTETDTYSFGGNLPEDYNLALYEHKKNRNIGLNYLNIPNDIINRGDLELVDDNKEIFDEQFGFGVKNGLKTKVKISVYFWFEGWDADCFEIIDAVNVRLNLEFATDSNVQ